MGTYTNRMDKRLKITNASYKRYQYQSYMTSPEWRNVEMAEELAAFIHENHSIFQFPYFRQIADLWRVIYNSYSAARKYNSAWEILTSEYMVMDLFIGFFTTMEMIPKGFISLILYPFLKAENESEMQGKVADYFDQYAEDLQTIPFYDHHYKENRETLAEAYKSCENKTWVDWFTWKSLSIELWARHWISKPLSYWFHQEGNIVEATTDVIVKYRAENVDDLETAKEQFRDYLAQVSDVSIVDEDVYARRKEYKESQKQDELESIESKQPDVYAREKEYENSQGQDEVKPIEPKQPSTYVYARLRTPRYALFQQVVRALADQDIHLRKIAGQDQVQVKCVVNGAIEEDAELDEQLEHKIEQVSSVLNAKPLYTHGDRIHPQLKTCFFDIPVKNLDETLEKFDDVQAEVKFIHNF